jgi:hypothetical protein
MAREPNVTQRAPNVITGMYLQTVKRNAIEVFAGLVVTDLPLIKGKSPKKTFMKVETGEQTFKTEDFKAASQSPHWTTNILVYAAIFTHSTEEC